MLDEYRGCIRKACTHFGASSTQQSSTKFAWTSARKLFLSDSQPCRFFRVATISTNVFYFGNYCLMQQRLCLSCLTFGHAYAAVSVACSLLIQLHLTETVPLCTWDSHRCCALELWTCKQPTKKPTNGGVLQKSSTSFFRRLDHSCKRNRKMCRNHDLGHALQREREREREVAGLWRCPLSVWTTRSGQRGTINMGRKLWTELLWITSNAFG
jgi:hypothetical protein